MTIRGDTFKSIGFPVSSSTPVSGGDLSPPSQSLIHRWHKAELENVTTSSGAVSQWDDISGNGNHLTQSVASNRPTWIQATSSFNGQSAVQFDGVNDYMVDLHSAITGSDITFGISFRKNKIGGVVDGIISFSRPGTTDHSDDTTFNYNTGRKSPPSLDDEIETGGALDPLLDDASTGKTDWTVVRIKGGSVDVIKQILTGSVAHEQSRSFGADWDIDKTIIGARDPEGNQSILQHFTGDYYELIVYDGALVDGDMVLLDTYLSSSLAGIAGSAPLTPSSSIINPEVGFESGLLSFDSFVNQSASGSATLTNAPSASNPTFWVPVETPSGSGAIPVWI